MSSGSISTNVKSRPSSSSSSSSSHFLAGLGSGILSAVLLQPADLLKTRVQQSGSSSLWTVLRDISRAPLPLHQLWRGTLPSTLRTGMGSALYFSTLNNLRQRVARSQILNPSTVPTNPASTSSSTLPKLSHLANLTTGAIARGSVGFVMMPITVLKVRFESNLYAYKSLWGACRDIWAREGLRGFFAGFGATAVRDAPYAGLYVLFYEGSKKRLSAFVQQSSWSSSSLAPPAPTISPPIIAVAAEKTIEAGAAVAASAASKAISSSSSSLPANNDPMHINPHHPNNPTMAPLQTDENHGDRTRNRNSNETATMLKGSHSASINFVSGMLAASLATALTNPFDAIKTRIQLLPAQYTNMIQAGSKMIRNDGVRSLFDGLGLRMARKAMSSALAWTVYEEVIRRVERRGRVQWKL